MRSSCNQGIRKNQSYLLGEVSTINFFGGFEYGPVIQTVELQIRNRKTVGMGYRDCISNASLFATSCS
ncbi:unnamed protein product [Tenebrio molitor]|nr:unnamed protein product [Tenebrio molitor]